MKRLFTFLLLVVNLVVAGQSFQLFNNETQKVYTDLDPLANTYGFGFDSIISRDNETIYFPYRDINQDVYILDTCSMYFDQCYRKDKPKWIGDSIIQSAELYTFRNKWKIAIPIDFSIQGQQSHTFYEDFQQRFSITPSIPSIDTMVFDGIVDSVLRFTISHTDAHGVTINSELNGWEIVIGKELGLINFFRIDSFPRILTPLRLLGTKSPDAGFYQLTNNDIYDYQIGDEFQYMSWNNWPFYNSYNYEYTLIQILNRSENETTIQYLARREKLIIDSAYFTVDTIPLTYQKNDIIATIPFVENLYENFYYMTLSIKDYCGIALMTYRISDGALSLDPECNLWCDIDMGGPGGWYTKEYVVGVGVYHDSYSAAHVEERSYGTKVVYFRKNGNTCGVRVEGIRNNKNIDQKLVIAPNPATVSFIVKGSFIESNLTISDMRGNVMSEIAKYSTGTQINISNLSPGVYIVKLDDKTGIKYGKLVVH